jgi:hypothetical protein
MSQYEPFVPFFDQEEFNNWLEHRGKIEYKRDIISKDELKDVIGKINEKREARKKAEREAREAREKAEKDYMEWREKERAFLKELNEKNTGKLKATGNWNMTPGTYLRESVKHMFSKFGRKKSGGRRSCKKGTRRHSKKKGTRRR